MNTDDLEKLYQPIGRMKELKKVQSVLAEHNKPALVVVMGKEGMGKTTFLNMVAKLASQINANMHVLSLSISLDMNRNVFEQTLRQQLEEIEKSEKELSFSGQIDQEILGPNATVRSEPRVITKTEEFSSNENLLPIVRELLHKSPLLMQIDGYQPNASFSSWFTSGFIPDILKSKLSVIVTITGRSRALTSLAKLTDYKISIKELSRAEVKQHFKRLSRHLKLPLDEKEVQVYTDEIVKKPYLFDPLTRTLLMPVTAK
ncbi:AAA family ATPase [candidate division KSB1 bacterium]|nr:AAA family ATPase [candidate division KSB1 bacterium]